MKDSVQRYDEMMRPKILKLADYIGCSDQEAIDKMNNLSMEIVEWTLKSLDELTPEDKLEGEIGWIDMGWLGHIWLMPILGLITFRSTREAPHQLNDYIDCLIAKLEDAKIDPKKLHKKNKIILDS